MRPRKYYSNAERQRAYREREARRRELARSAGKLFDALQNSRTNVTPRKRVIEIKTNAWFGLRVVLECGHVVIASLRFNRVLGTSVSPKTCLCRECGKVK